MLVELEIDFDKSRCICNRLCSVSTSFNIICDEEGWDGDILTDTEYGPFVICKYAYSSRDEISAVSNV